MKRLFPLVLFLMIVFVSLPAYAGGATTYTIDDLFMTIDIPSSWMVFSPDTDENDPNLDVVGFTAADLKQQFADKNIYLNAVLAEPLTEVVITMEDYDSSQRIFNLNQYSQADLDKLAAEMVPNIEDFTNAVYTYTGTYQGEQAMFLMFDLKQELDGQPVYGYQYYTIFNGKAINITMHSYTGPISDGFAEIHRQMVDSVVFTTVKDNPNSTSSSSHPGRSAVTVTITGSAVGLVSYFSARAKKRKKQKQVDDFDSF
jgi:hypothetical protein